MSQRLGCVVVAALAIAATAIVGVATSGIAEIFGATAWLSRPSVHVDPLHHARAADVAWARKLAQPVRLTSARPGESIRSMPWQFLALLDGGRTILLSYAIGSSCDAAIGLRVVQSSDSVEVGALSHTHHGWCEQSLVGAVGTVRLDRPLGAPRAWP